MANKTDDLGLPPMSFIEEVFPHSEIPEFDRKYHRRQGPASVKKDPKGRVFTAGGPAADKIIQCIFADQGLTRSQIAKVVGCSPSRVTEVIWALDAAKRKKQIESYPAVPRQPGLVDREDEEPPAAAGDEEVTDGDEPEASVQD